ncbi:MAG: DUF4367 domain-containing protein [Thaumarchaeota archaeon]|nr:DUF4367 domain-containing protein [Nitrososphaerota archaeon]
MVPSKLPDNATLESVRMQRGSAYTTLLYSDGLKIIQGPGYGLPRVMELLEGSPGVYRFLYADAEGIGHDPWIERLTNGTNIRHKGYLGFWRDEPLWLSELIGDRSSAELREIAISMLQSLKGRPVPDEMRGRSVSLSEASELAKMAGFRIRLPTQLPAQFQLMDVRVAEFPPRIDLNQTHPKINARLIYSPTPSPANATSLDLLKSGGFILNLKERIVVGEFEALYKLFRGREENSTARKITIRGNEGIYFAWPAAGVQAMYWYDEEMQLQIIASSKRLDMQQLITIAESIP